MNQDNIHNMFPSTGNPDKPEAFIRDPDSEEACFNIVLQLANALDAFIDSSSRNGKLIGGSQRLIGGLGAIQLTLASIMQGHDEACASLNDMLVEGEEPLTRMNFQWE